jgi:hypothetical protein
LALFIEACVACSNISYRPLRIKKQEMTPCWNRTTLEQWEDNGIVQKVQKQKGASNKVMVTCDQYPSKSSILHLEQGGNHLQLLYIRWPCFSKWTWQIWQNIGPWFKVWK